MLQESTTLLTSADGLFRLAKNISIALITRVARIYLPYRQVRRDESQ